jgi:hypothetical protein
MTTYNAPLPATATQAFDDVATFVLNRASVVSDRILLRGVQVVGNNVLPPGLPFPTQTTLTRVDLVINTVPTGSALIVLVRQGAIVLASVSIAAGASTGSTVLSTPARVAAGTPVVLDITQVGLSVPGGDMMVVLTTNAAVTPGLDVLPFNVPGATTWDAATWGTVFGANNPGTAAFSVPSAGIGRYAGAVGGTHSSVRALTDAYAPITTANMEFSGAINIDNRASTDGNIQLDIRLTPRATGFTRQGLRLSWNTDHFEKQPVETGQTFGTVATIAGGAAPGWLSFRVRGVGNQLMTKLWTYGGAEPGAWDTTNTLTLTPLAGTAALEYNFGNNHSVDFKELRVQVL